MSRKFSVQLGYQKSITKFCVVVVNKVSKMGEKFPTWSGGWEQVKESWEGVYVGQYPVRRKKLHQHLTQGIVNQLRVASQVTEKAKGNC